MADNAGRDKMINPLSQPLKGEKGTILVLVLWVIALLTMIAGYFSVEARLRGNLGYGSWNLLKSRLEIESLLNLASFYLAPIEQDKDAQDPEHFLFADGSRYRVRMNGRDLEFTIEDERGKVDLNKVSEEELDNILTALLGNREGNQASHISDAIMDWRDNDDDKRSGGAESDFYESLNPPYKPANAKFLLLEQLLLVRGVGPRLFWGPIEWKKKYTKGKKGDIPLWKGGIQDLFTVYNQAGTVLRAAAPEPLLDILDEKDLSEKGGKGTLRLRACLYQGCYQIFWEAEKQQNRYYKLIHWQQIPRFD